MHVVGEGGSLGRHDDVEVVPAEVDAGGGVGGGAAAVASVGGGHGHVEDGVVVDVNGLAFVRRLDLGGNCNHPLLLLLLQLRLLLLMLLFLLLLLHLFVVVVAIDAAATATSAAAAAADAASAVFAFVVAIVLAAAAAFAFFAVAVDAADATSSSSSATAVFALVVAVDVVAAATILLLLSLRFRLNFIPHLFEWEVLVLDYVPFPPVLLHQLVVRRLHLGLHPVVVLDQPPPEPARQDVGQGVDGLGHDGGEEEGAQVAAVRGRDDEGEHKPGADEVPDRPRPEPLVQRRHRLPDEGAEDVPARVDRVAPEHVLLAPIKVVLRPRYEGERRRRAGQEDQDEHPGGEVEGAEEGEHGSGEGRLTQKVIATAGQT